LNKVYICDSCRFLFERAGEVDRCPDCGKKNIRSADEQEQEEYRQLRREFGYDDI